MNPGIPTLQQKYDYTASKKPNGDIVILTYIPSPNSYILTTVCIAPGFCTLRALTTWNTSTTPSVLHLSMVVAIAQNIPDLLTVSLYIGMEI